MNNAQLINQDSGDYEYYTPPEIVDAAREVMGSIDLDPASSYEANQTIKSTAFMRLEKRVEFTNHLDMPSLVWMNGGLDHLWWGNVWMNHPFARTESPCKKGCDKEICKKRGHHTDIEIPGNKEWIRSFIDEFRSGRVSQAICITYASTSEDWFRPLMDYIQCFLQPRTNYYLPDGTKKKGVTKGSVVTYLGPNMDKFKEVFESFGKVK